MIIGKKIGIYKITNPKGAVYIGQSRDISKRRTSYRGISKKNKGQPKLYNSLVKYGTENHTFEILEECELAELNIKERYWQDFYDACNRHNLNCTLTSTDEIPQIVSDETKKKQSVAAKIRMKRLIKDPIYLAKMKEVYKNQVGRKMPPRSDSYRQLRKKQELEKGNWKGDKNPWFGIDRSGENNTMFGRTQSEETKAKIAAKAKGRLHSDKAKNLMSEKRSLGKNIHAKLVLNFETGIYYECVKEAWMSVSNCAYSTMKCRLNGSLKNHTSFKQV